MKTVTPLEERIIKRIEQDGPITFRDFMQRALYDPELGYYQTERIKIGPGGDYYTSSNVHDVFGEILAETFIELWDEVKSGSEPLAVLEAGAGTGQLARDILGAVQTSRPDLFRDFQYLIIEASRAMQALQHKTLSDFSGRVAWTNRDGLERNPFAGIVFSNELLDAFAVHVVQATDRSFRERWVGASGGRLYCYWSDISDPRIASYIARLDMDFFEGRIFEVNLEAIDWLRTVSSWLRFGYLMIIDYGDISRVLYSPGRRDGTLRCFYKHILTDSPLERVGLQDITADVNFSTLIDHGQELGFDVVSFETQRAFLIRKQLPERIARSEKPSLSVKSFLIPGGASENFRVLILKKPRH